MQYALFHVISFIYAIQIDGLIFIDRIYVRIFIRFKSTSNLTLPHIDVEYVDCNKIWL